MLELVPVVLAGGVRGLLENSGFLLGAPLVALGVIGILIVLAPIGVARTPQPEAAAAEAQAGTIEGGAHPSPREYVTIGLILGVAVHSAGIQDRDGVSLVMDRLTARFPFIEKIFADGSYAGPIAQSNSPRPFEIIKRSDDAKGFVVLPKRWVVERTFAWLGINRRLAKDFERFAKTAVTFIQTAMIKLMTRRLARYVEF